jgi:outer membrane protein
MGHEQKEDVVGRRSILFRWVVFLACAGGQVLLGQSKVAYVDSPRILSTFSAAVDANRQLETENNQWAQELRQMQQKFSNVTEELEKQSLLLSDAKKAEKIQERQALYEEIQQYQDRIWGENGEYFKRQNELLKPVYDKINEVIQKIAEDEDYDYVLDTAQGNILFAKEEDNLTDRVLEELESGVTGDRTD